MQQCLKCGIPKSASEFPTESRRKSGRATWCKLCHNAYRKRYYPKRRENRPRNYRKFWPEESIAACQKRYDEMHVSQDGLCAICRKPETATDRKGVVKKLAVDHNHSSGQVRGLLCQRCNVAIALLQESADLFDAAKNYLDRCAQKNSST
jgi:hypothetical protein